MSEPLKQQANSNRNFFMQVFGKRTRGRQRGSEPTLSIEALEERTLLTVGELDTTFSNDGLGVTDFTELTGAPEQTEGVEIDSDGKIVTVGLQNFIGGQQGFVTRHMPDGSLDTSFGAGGKVITGVFNGGGLPGQVKDVTVLPDNSILITGPVVNGGSDDFGVLKLTPDGNVDISFGTRGLATVDFGGGNDDFPRAIVQNGTNIVIAGSTDTGDLDFAVVELDADGNQTAFGTQIIAFDLGGTNDDIAYDVKIDNSNRILLAGSADTAAGHDFALARRTAAGAADGTFDGGQVTIDFGTSDDEAFSVVVAPDNSINVGGVTDDAGTEDFALARLNNGGTLQNGFGTNGRVIQDFAAGGNPSQDRIAEIQLQGDNLVVAGQSRETIALNPQVDLAVGVFNRQTGALDASFNPGTGGRIHTTFFAYGQDAGHALAIDADGNWVVAGNVGQTTNADFPTNVGGLLTNISIARYTGTNGQLDASFGNNGRVIADTTDLTGVSDSARAVEVHTDDGKIVTGGVTFGVGGAGTSGIVSRYNPDGSLDTSFGFDGILSVGLFDIDGITDLTVLADHSIVAVGSVFRGGTSDFGAVKLTPSGGIDTSFGTSGFATVDFGPGFEDTPRAIVQNGTDLVIAGDTFNGDSDFAVVELDASGNPTGFGTQIIAFDLGGTNNDIAYDVKVDNSNRILLAGSAATAAGNDFALARRTAAGAADGTFGGGEVTIDFDASDDQAYSVVVAPDNSINVGGYTDDAGTEDFALARLNNEGVLQNGFGTGGKVIQDFAPGGDDSNDRIAEIVLDGTHIVVAGQSREAIAVNPQIDFAVGRFNRTTGALDAAPNPGNGGRVHTTFYANRQDSAYAAAIDGDGKWIVAGASGLTTDPAAVGPFGPADFQTNVALTRYETSGQLDTSFGNNGRVTTDFTRLSGMDDEARGVEVQADGKIVVAGGMDFFGFGFWEGAVARYNPDGSLDDTFGVGGRANVSVFNRPPFFADATGGSQQFGITDLTVLPDGSILVIGPVLDATLDFGVLKLTPDGNIDETFGTRGLATVDFGPGNEDTPRAIVQNGANLVIAGDSSNGGNFDMAVVELDANGNQTAFGAQTVAFDLGGANRDVAFDVKVDDSGRVLLAGSAEVAAGEFDFALARLTPAGGTDATFAGGTVNVNIGAAATNDEAFSVVIAPDNSINAAGYTMAPGGNEDFALIRLNEQGVLQNGFGTDGKVIQDFAPGGNDSDDRIAEIAYQDGQLVTGGDSIETIAFAPRSDFATGSFDAQSGELETALNLGTGGRVHTTFLTNQFELGTGLALQPDGKWIQIGASGDFADNFAIARFLGPNAAPVIDGLANTTYTEGEGAKQIASAATLVDSDGDNIKGLTISLTNAVGADNEVIAVTLPAGITLDGASTSTNLILTGDATAAAYQTALRSLTYSNPSEDPTDAPDRMVSIVATDAGDATSTAVMITIDVTPVNDVPVVDLNSTPADGNVNLTVGPFEDAAIAIAEADASVFDPDTDNLTSLVITITNNQAGDTLDATESGGISKGFAGGVLTLSGAASPAAYQTVLRTVTFNTTSDDTTSRVISFVANDGTAGPAAETTVTFSAGSGVGDLDGSGTLSATDANLVVHILSGLPAAAITPFLSAGATQTAQQAIDAFNANRAVFDIDGNGTTSATDANLIIHVLSGLPAAAIEPFRGAGFTRSGQEMIDYVNTTLNPGGGGGGGGGSASAMSTPQTASDELEHCFVGDAAKFDRFFAAFEEENPFLLFD